MAWAPPVRVFPLLDDDYRRAARIGAVAATLLFVFVLSVGRLEITEAPTGNFYDLQARAWLDGQWDIPPDDDGANPLGFEAIVVDGEAHMYYGPVPALLRLPFLVFNQDIDGKLTQVSMLVAFYLALDALLYLGWRIRHLVRGEVSVHQREALVIGLFTFGLGAGTVLLFLGSQATVYHEAILWSLAFAFFAFGYLLEAAVHAAGRTVVWAGLFAGLSLLTRASVGIGPVVGLAALLVAVGIGDVRARRRPDVVEDREAPDVEDLPPPENTARGDERLQYAFEAFAPEALAPADPPYRLLLGAIFVPVLLYAGVNYMRFDAPFSLPLDQQVYTTFSPDRQAALDANGGSLFAVGYVRSTVWQYVRPDAYERDALAPWINFPREPASVVGDAVFDTRDEASSVTATMPLLAALALVGAATVIRPPPVENAYGRHAGVLAVPLAGAAAGCVGVLTIGFIANRYLGDLLPLLVLLAFAGLHRCGRWFGGPITWQGPAAAAPLLALGAWGVFANVGLAMEYQRLIAPVDDAVRAGWIDLQYSRSSDATRLTQVDEPPTGVGERGDIVIVGDCGFFVPPTASTGVYWTDGVVATGATASTWYLVADDGEELCIDLLGVLYASVGELPDGAPATTVVAPADAVVGG